LNQRKFANFYPYLFGYNSVNKIVPLASAGRRMGRNKIYRNAFRPERDETVRFNLFSTHIISLAGLEVIQLLFFLFKIRF
jgi:hypothetical protein